MYNSFKLEREINFLLNDSTFLISTPIYIDIIIYQIYLISSNLKYLILYY